MYHLELVREKDIAYKDVLPIENAATIFHEMLDSSPVEKLAVIHCNTQMKMIGAEIVAVGAIDKVGANMCDIFRGAIRNNAHSIWLAHNHVDGNVQASPQDYVFTQKVVESGILLGIGLYDHLVIAPEKFFSIWDHPDEMKRACDKYKADLLYKQMTDSLKKIPLSKPLPGDKELIESLRGKSTNELTNQLLDILDGLTPKV